MVMGVEELAPAISAASHCCAYSPQVICGFTFSHKSRSERIIGSAGMLPPKFSSARIPSIASS
jgi:hypothetical protein